MSSEFSNSKEENWKEEKTKKLQEFDELLADITEASSKEKILWRQIYENAIQDRKIAISLVFSLHTKFMVDSSEHTLNGSQMNGYLTRMEKSNKQLIELAGIVADRNSKDESINSDDLFEAMRADDSDGSGH